MRNVYGSIQASQIQKQEREERINKLCFIGLVIMGVITYAII